MHLVTGGSGSFGQIVVQQLLARGEAVRVFDLSDFEGRHRAAVDLVRGDIRDAAAVGQACRGVTHIHHNVAQVPLAKDTALFWSVNRDGLLQSVGLYHQKFHVLSEMNMTIACDITRAKEELGYRPLVELREGMRRSIAWCLDQGLEI